MPADALLRYQHGLLERMLRHARAEVPAYATRLGAVFDGEGRFLVERWRDLPLLTKTDISRDNDSFQPPAIPPELQPVINHQTMGTTGTPLSVPRTRLSLVVAACFVERRSRWHDIDSSLPLAMIRFVSGTEADFPEGRSQKGWSPTHPDADIHTLSVRSTVDEQIDWLRRRRPAYLQLYPSVAAEIAARIGKDGAALGIRKIFTFGETVSDDQRAIVKSALGADLIDTYSASEVGTIAVQCPASDSYHVMAEGNFLELLDDAGAPVEPGSPGRVVVTPIYNTAMPLVRYDIGDFAEAIEGPCPCGRTLPRLRRIMGRSRQMFRFADGSVRWPNVHTGDLTAIVPLREFQFVQHSATDIEFCFERIAGHAGVVDFDALETLVRRDLHPGVSIRVSELETIPRAPGGKFERYLSHVGAGRKAPDSSG